jgi:uncharacterized protein involved in response to NO
MAGSFDHQPDAMSQRPGRWRREPFRIFFPLGVLLAWLGVGHWLLYRIGVTQTYSCFFHGLVQMQAFMMAFAVGFLFTALPRRTQSAPPSTLELTAAGFALLTTAVAAVLERWRLAEAAYAMVFVLLLQFAVRRFLGPALRTRPPEPCGGWRPPADVSASLLWPARVGRQGLPSPTGC